MAESTGVALNPAGRRTADRAGTPGVWTACPGGRRGDGNALWRVAGEGPGDGYRQHSCVVAGADAVGIDCAGQRHRTSEAAVTDLTHSTSVTVVGVFVGAFATDDQSATAHLDGGFRRLDTGKVESGDQVVAVLTDVGSRRETGTSVRSHGPEVTEQAVDVGEGAGDQSVGHGNLLVVSS